MHTKQSYKWCWGILGVNSPYIINSSIPELHFWRNWMPSSFLNPIVLQNGSLLSISPRLEANQFLCGWWSAQVSDQKISKLFCRKACTINAGMVKVTTVFNLPTMPPLSCHKNNEIQVERENTSDAFVLLSKPKESVNATPPNVCHLPLKQRNVCSKV